MALLKFLVNIIKKLVKLFGGAKKKGKGAQAGADAGTNGQTRAVW